NERCNQRGEADHKQRADAAGNGHAADHREKQDDSGKPARDQREERQSKIRVDEVDWHGFLRNRNNETDFHSRFRNVTLLPTSSACTRSTGLPATAQRKRPPPSLPRSSARVQTSGPEAV